MAEVVSWRPEYRADFERLNREWIEAYFAVEPSDLAVFRDPEEAIVRPGGEIFFVVDDEGVRGVGVVSQGLGMDGGRGEASYAVDQVVLDLVADLVRFDQ